MYTIKVDGQVIWSPALAADDDQYKIISPRLQLEVDSPGSLAFTLPPGHVAHDTIQKMKHIITMEWDGVEIFRGRALEEKTDTYNQKEIYCEGDLSFLLDSIQRPFTHNGTARAYIKKAIDEHNAQVEAEKRFTLGNMAALTDDTTMNLESDGYSDTLSAIRAVLGEREGYLRTRYEDGVRYLDYITSSGANNGQAIEFGVNLLDLDNQVAAEEICTVLLPIGGMLENGTTVTIASANNGSDTIENAEGIAQYGRIVKTYAFDDVTDPAKLLKLAQAKLKEMSIGQSLTLKAVDMHLLDSEKGMILPGVPVLIHTQPHGIDKEEVCTAADIDPANPEKSVYTFGKPTKTQSGTAALIANTVRTHTNTLMQQLKHYVETDYTVKIHTGLLDSHEKYLAEAKIEMDGINARLDLTVQKDGLISAINMSPESIKISSSVIELDGQAIVSALEGSHIDVYSIEASEVDAELLYAGSIFADSVQIGESMAVTESWLTEQGYATQAWVNGQDFATHTYVTTALKPYALVTDVVKKSALTTKEIEYVYKVSLDKELHNVPGADGVGHVVLSSATLTYNTAKTTVVVYA